MTVNEPLLHESELNDGNLMTISIGSLYSPPDSWTMSQSQYMYGAAMPIPISGEVKHYHTLMKFSLRISVMKIKMIRLNY